MEVYYHPFFCTLTALTAQATPKICIFVSWQNQHATRTLVSSPASLNPLSTSLRIQRHVVRRMNTTRPTTRPRNVRTIVKNSTRLTAVITMPVMAINAILATPSLVSSSRKADQLIALVMVRALAQARSKPLRSLSSRLYLVDYTIYPSLLVLLGEISTRSRS